MDLPDCRNEATRGFGRRRLDMMYQTTNGVSRPCGGTMSANSHGRDVAFRPCENIVARTQVDPFAPRRSRSGEKKGRAFNQYPPDDRGT